jgi:2-polyprenyl-6-methoxyphenol hydroxylase-like FAD-dependent oxidoreductase
MISNGSDPFEGLADRGRGAPDMAVVDKVLVVGGSIAGMSCALQLRKIGIGVDLIEIDPNWRSYGAGITISGPTLRALRSIGVLEQVVESGATWSGVRVHDKAGNLLEDVDFPPLAPDLPASAGIMRPALHGILSTATKQAGVNVRLGVSVAGVLEDERGVDVGFTDASKARYELVVGADGIFSQLRQRIFPHAAKPVTTGQIVYRLVAERPSGFDRTHFFMGEDSKVGFNPVSSTHMYMFLLHRATSNPRIDPEDQPRKLFAAMEGFGGFVPRIRETVLTSNAHTINYRPLETLLQPAPWHTRRVILVGDAAHATTPHLASGAGMAIEDGIVLAEELQRRESLPDACGHFMSRRFERCRIVIENSVRLGEIEMNHGSKAEYTRLMGESMGILRSPI